MPKSMPRRLGKRLKTRPSIPSRRILRENTRPRFTTTTAFRPIGHMATESPHNKWHGLQAVLLRGSGGERMSYLLLAGESTAAGIKRVIEEELESAAAQLGQEDVENRDEAIHEARK